MDFREEELEWTRKTFVEHTVTVTHKASGISIRGKGAHQHQLECNLLEELRRELRNKANG